MQAHNDGNDGLCSVATDQNDALSQLSNITGYFNTYYLSLVIEEWVEILKYSTLVFVLRE